MTNKDINRMKEINGFLNRPYEMSDEKLLAIADQRGINYILQRTEGKTLVDAHSFFLANFIADGRSINQIVDANGIELSKDVAFIDSGCACGNDRLGIQIAGQMYSSRKIVYSSMFLGGSNHRRTLNQLDIPTLLTYGPIFQGIEVEGNCTPSSLVDRKILSYDEADSLTYYEMRKMPLEKQVEFLTRKMLDSCDLELTSDEAANYHVIPTRSYKF